MPFSFWIDRRNYKIVLHQLQFRVTKCDMNIQVIRNHITNLPKSLEHIPQHSTFLQLPNNGVKALECWWQLQNSQSNRHHQQTKPLKGKYCIPHSYSPQAHLRVFQLCLRTLKVTPGYLGDGCHASRQPSDEVPLLQLSVSFYTALFGVL